MFKKLWNAIFSSHKTPPAPNLPPIRDTALALLAHADAMPYVGWEAAEDWISRQSEYQDHPLLRRAIASYWLEEFARTAPFPATHWRSGTIEGFAPANNKGADLRNSTERILRVIHSTLIKIRGAKPIPPVALLAFPTQDTFITYHANLVPEDTVSMMPGGVYFRAHDGWFPMLLLNMKGDPRSTIAHELTHHALAECHLPMWIEEGLTQMMEERAAGRPPLLLNAEEIARHRLHWRSAGFEDHLSAQGFHSPDGEVSQRSYELAEWTTRLLLEQRPDDFFRFARSCRTLTATDACETHFGVTPDELLSSIVRM